MWRDEEETTECGKEDCFDNFSQGVNEDSQVGVENEIKELLGEVEHDPKDETKTQGTVEPPNKVTHVVQDGVVAQGRATGDLEGTLEEMRRLKNERRFKNRSTVRQDDLKAWREKSPDVVRKYSRRKLIKAQGAREMSMKIEDIIKEGKDPVSLGWL
jgi:hypothetical protein